MLAFSQTSTNLLLRSADGIHTPQEAAAAQSQLNHPGLLTTLMFALFFFLIIVLPNSIRPIKIAMFPLLAIYCFAQLRRIDSELLIAWGLIACTTIFYSLFPPQSRMTPVVFVQFGFVYVAAPLFWMLIADYVFKTWTFDQIKMFLFWMTIAALLSIGLFYYLFLNYGATAVWMFMDHEHANVKMNHEQNDYQATMHVFGSLIFIGAAFIASETLGAVRKSIIMLVIVTAAVVSGRDAFVVSVGMGAVVYMFFRYLDLAKQKVAISTIVVTTLIIIAFFTPYGETAMRKVMTKFNESGGTERRQQIGSLVQAIQKDWLLGAGNTAHVDIIRDPERPWRYEVLPLAILYRVGLLGALCYFYPVISVFWRMGGLMRAGAQNQVDIFMFTGLTATLVCTLTNPYLESFEFQWCLYFPFCYFRLRRQLA